MQIIKFSILQELKYDMIMLGDGKVSLIEENGKDEIIKSKEVEFNQFLMMKNFLILNIKKD